MKVREMKALFAAPDVSGWDEQELLIDRDQCQRILDQYPGTYYAELCQKRLTVVLAALAPAAAQSAEAGR